MPHLSGFDLISKLDKIDFAIVFTTAYNEFAIQAFKVNAVDYLLKPISKEDLLGAVAKVHERMNIHSDNLNINALINGFGLQQPMNGKVSLSSMDGLEFVEVKTIIRCEADSNYTHVILEDGGKITISKTLKDLEDQLANFPFMRVHNSHLVNLNRIKSYQRGAGGTLVMDNNDTIPVSRGKKNEFLDYLN